MGIEIIGRLTRRRVRGRFTAAEPGLSRCFSAEYDLLPRRCVRYARPVICPCVLSTLPSCVVPCIELNAQNPLCFHPPLGVSSRMSLLFRVEVNRDWFF